LLEASNGRHLHGGNNGDGFHFLLSCKLAICIRKKGLLDDDLHNSNKSKGQIIDENVVSLSLLGLIQFSYNLFSNLLICNNFYLIYYVVEEY